MTGLEVYQVYLGMKLHFSNKTYDYLTYGPKRVDESSMGKYYVMANAISRKFANREALELRLVALFKRKVVWLNEIATPEAEKIERQHLADLNALSYNFENHLTLIQEECGSVKSALKTDNAFSVPSICRMLLNKEVNVETYCILDELVGFSRHINDLVWKDEKLKIEKYKSFFNPDLKRFASIAKPFFV